MHMQRQCQWRTGDMLESERTLKAVKGVKSDDVSRN